MPTLLDVVADLGSIDKDSSRTKSLYVGACECHNVDRVKDEKALVVDDAPWT